MEFAGSCRTQPASRKQLQKYPQGLWLKELSSRQQKCLCKQGKLFRESDFKWSGQTGQFEYGGTQLVIHPTKQNPVMSPPPPKIEIVERRKKITLQDLRRMSSREYAEALRNPTLASQIEELLHYS
jgi:hypothetical protein